MIEFSPQRVILLDDERRRLALAKVTHAPLGLEVLIREPVKVRTLDQNARMWAGPLRDIAEQGWVDGRQFAVETWHEYFKREYLPEDDDPELGRLVKNPEAWSKWGYMPNGERALVGSTTDLTVHGFARYLEQVYAYGAALGVLFGVGQREFA